MGNSANAISFSVPILGSEVRVIFPTGEKHAPYYTGAEINSNNKCTFFDEDYPMCYGIKDEKGNFVKVNKTTGTTVLQHSSTTNIEIVESGAYTITDPSGSTFQCDGNGRYSMDGISLSVKMSKNIIFETGVFLVTATGFVKLDTPMTTTTGGLGSEIAATTTYATGDGQTVTVSQGITNNVEES